ncbi:RES family NAD+ phosphorylase [Pedobacter agri]|uniref:RES family NAD+ phosphorylase n=1 Tax=Pedobacter agri TaxID=454586 RepID=A0A9X3D9Q4_9SPHI|nr:RES family NAD+ phosphorylase [Pedobacter agri]MCX3263588.1 RES family NAD+ phosphorylase [Pedobacter agri]
MILYRISNCKYARDISGTGAKMFGGRWNSAGTPMHYMAENRALAALEVLVNIDNVSDTSQLCLSIFELSDESIELCNLNQLPKNWRAYSSSFELQKIGDEFVKTNKYLLLRVPSAIIEDEFNFLMNVNHPLAENIKILEIKPFSFDNRLL